MTETKIYHLFFTNNSIPDCKKVLKGTFLHESDAIVTGLLMTKDERNSHLEKRESGWLITFTTWDDQTCLLEIIPDKLINGIKY